MAEKIETEFKSVKTQNQYEKLSKNVQEMQRKYSLSLAALIKTLLKNKNGKEDTLKWLGASIMGNTARAKMGH